MRRFTNKRAVAALCLIALLAVAGGAYAYFTNNNGSATGSGSVGASSPWHVTATAFTGGPLYPGSGTETGTTTVTNTSNGNQKLTTITATIAAPTNTGTDATIPACTASDFALSDPGSNWNVASGGQSATYSVGVDEAGTSPGPAGSVTTPQLTISMNDASHNQNNCQNATPNVTYTVN
jgi:hypothetical protein